MNVRRVVSMGLAGSVAAAGLVALPAGGASAASSTVYKACVNKKSGDMRLLKNGKKCKKGEKKITWNQTGPTGPQGAKGDKGDTGARGPAGAFTAFDQAGREIGTLMGFLGGGMPLIRTSGGAMLLWNNNPADPNSMMIIPAVLYYRQAGCAGDAYSMYNPGIPFDVGIILAATGAPGSPVFHLTPGTPQAFNSVSVRTPAGCVAAVAAVTNAYVAKDAGTVPAVTQPLLFQPAQ